MRKIVFLMLMLTFLAPASLGWWFDKDSSKDTIYAKLDELTGSVETHVSFYTNTSGYVYCKVLGDEGVSPWLTPGSSWYLDLYMKPDPMGDWIKVASYVQNPNPSKAVYVDAYTVCELKAIIYHPTTIETYLTRELNPTDDIIYLKDARDFPARGVLKIENEYVKYEKKNANDTLVQLIHGYMDTTPDYHPNGTRVKLFSGLYHIPIVIALNISIPGGGGGGALHPSFCHAVDFLIAEGKPPHAVFSCIKWYNKVTVNASSSYDEDGKIVAYQWDWESDGVFDDVGMVAEHVYDSPGYRVITLRVVDDDGMADTYTMPVNIIMPPEQGGNILFMRIFGLTLWMWIVVVIFILGVVFIIMW